MKQLKRKLEQTPEADDAERLKRQLHVAEVDEAYAIYHPHLEPYNSLYGSTARSKEDKDDDKDGDFDARYELSVKEKMDEWKRGYYKVH